MCKLSISNLSKHIHILYFLIVDKPDPYVILKVPGSPSGSKKTKYFNNTSSPTWNQSFTFILDPQKTYCLGKLRILYSEYKNFI